jgi:ankyrin repeat protein
LLVESRADIHVRNDEGHTPFKEASVKGHRNVMQLLLQHGARNDEV